MGENDVPAADHLPDEQPFGPYTAEEAEAALQKTNEERLLMDG